MTSQDVTPPRSPKFSNNVDHPLALPRVRSPERPTLRSSRPFSEYRPPGRRTSARLSSLFASTSGTSTPKRASSPSLVTPLVTQTAPSLFSPPLSEAAFSDANPYRDIVQRSFAPHIAVLPSADTEELLAQKGFNGGFLELVRPFGEQISGKVTIRDSTGSSKSWEDYAVRFTKLKDGLEGPRPPEPRKADVRSQESRSQNINGYLDQYFPLSSARLRTGGDVEYVEEVVEKHLSYAEAQAGRFEDDYFNFDHERPQKSMSFSDFHLLYLRRLLSGLPMSPHETFSHPVACVIAISSQNPDPIEELRQLYANTNEGDEKMPQWVNNDYLRYYVLVHDEEHDDISRSTSLFDQMKRHFGLHCHLLRLRSSQCVPSDDDAVQLPTCTWISAAEELAEIQKRESEDDNEPTPRCLFESDVTAVKSFVRELVTQSIVPVMERLRTQWNDQVASKRRGISGRFMSLSKKWTFGTSSRTSSSPSGSGSNYDSLQGFYRPDSPEAIIRKLADYAFMLRDFSLAQSAYDLLRNDYSNDKAWKYYAGACEMSAITTLMIKQPLTTKTKGESVDQLLEAASYSYLNRCTAPFNALRTLAVGLELLQLRGGSGADDAARWAGRIVEFDLVGPTGRALYSERVAACFLSRKGTGQKGWGSRRRKAALWGIMATEHWLTLGKNWQAEKCLAEVFQLYKVTARDMSSLSFSGMEPVLLDLYDQTVARAANLSNAEQAADDYEEDETMENLGQETETLNLHSRRQPSISLVPSTPDRFVAETVIGAAKALESDRSPLDEFANDAGKVDIRTHRKSLIGMSTAPSDPLGVSDMQSKKTGPG